MKYLIMISLLDCRTYGYNTHRGRYSNDHHRYYFDALEYITFNHVMEVSL